MRMIYLAHPFGGLKENVDDVEQIIKGLLHKHPACAGKFKDKTQKTIHQVPDKCQGGCRKRAMCLVWDVEVEHGQSKNQG